MGLKVTITIDGAKQIDRGIWKATLKPAEAATLGDCESKSGPFSVLLLESTVDYNSQSQSITFDPDITHTRGCRRGCASIYRSRKDR